MSLSEKDREFLHKINNEYAKISKIRDKIILAKKISRYYGNRFKNIRTISIKISLAKKYFKNKYPKDKRFWRNISPNKDITKKVLALNKKKLLETTITEIPKKFVDTFIKENEKSKNLEINVTYLLLASGRRFNEIIKGSFTNTKDKNKLHFTGLLKKRANKNSADIYILGNKQIFLKKFNIVKKLMEDKNKANYQRLFSRKIKVIMEEHDFINTHMLRVIYANYMFQYNNPKKIIYNSFIKSALNHETLLSSVNYSSIKLI